jgi:hypothetical protein
LAELGPIGIGRMDARGVIGLEAETHEEDGIMMTV